MAHITFLVRNVEILIAISSMSPTQSRIPQSDPRTRRRRHARHTPSNWVKRAGVTGGVIGAAVLTSGAAPASADNAAGHTPLNEVSQTLDLSQLRAADATARTAVIYELRASEAAAAANAAKAAQLHKEADRRKAAAKAAAKAEAAKKAAERKAGSGALLSDVTSSGSGNIASVLAFVKAQVGKAYVMGATGPSAFDCSGLVQAAFRTIGVDLPRVSESQSSAGTPVSLSDLKPGDILYWGSAGDAYHVAVYVGGGDFVGAQNPSSGVVERPLSYDEPTGAIRVG